MKLITTICLTGAVCTSMFGQKPNVIILLADDLGYADLGVQGSTDIPTPFINSLAENGIRFSNAYVTAPQSSPTRAGLLTGRYQQKFGHEYNFSREIDSLGISVKEKLIGDYLKPLGYHTGMAGKWHLGAAQQFHPSRRGFDEFWGFLGGGHDYFACTAGSHPNSIQAEVEKWGNVGSFNGYLTDQIGEAACDFINRNSDQPFFLYVAFNAPHAPLQAPEKYLQRVSEIRDPNRKIYGAMVVGMDDAVGRILKKLKELNIEENTLIFFLSDNGGPVSQNHSSNAPLRGVKGDMYEGGIRVPFIIQWKAKLAKGILSDHTVMSLDILPTIVAAAGENIQNIATTDGVNLLPFLADNKTKEMPRRAIYQRFFFRFDEWSIRQGDWKLVVSANRASIGKEGLHLPEKPELYNLLTDKEETNDLASQKPGLVRKLDRKWRKWNKMLVKPAWPPVLGQ